MTVQSILDYLNETAPLATQCGWDNSGFLVGDAAGDVAVVAFALDLTPQTLAGALEAKADLLVTHHPVIFQPQRSLLADRVLYHTVKSGLAVISLHTPWDCAAGGVNDVLSGLLGLTDVVPVPDSAGGAPMARIGSVDACGAKELAERVADALGTTVRLVDGGKPIARVAVCGGAGMSLLDDAVAAGADAFVTGELKHHEALDAAERGVTVIAAGHFETERPSMAALCGAVRQRFPQLSAVLLDETNPVAFVGPKG
ncbi:MAG: Nif3-like dinuclear metal center hexameric protein [Clostridia bacterium]|nr:Nif3-like dinuclear metal center hexameric protein [Clostridia bacterium]